MEALMESIHEQKEQLSDSAYLQLCNQAKLVYESNQNQHKFFRVKYLMCMITSTVRYYDEECRRVFPVFLKSNSIVQTQLMSAEANANGFFIREGPHRHSRAFKSNKILLKRETNIPEMEPGHYMELNKANGFLQTVTILEINEYEAV